VAPPLQNRAIMRRILLLAAAAVPVLVLAQVAASVGQVVETANNDGVNNYINAAQCEGTAPLNLGWNDQVASGSFSGTGSFRIIASDQPPSTTAIGTLLAGSCAEQSSTTTNPPVIATQIDSAPASNAIGSKPVTKAFLKDTFKYTCDSTSEGKAVWICSHLYDAGTNQRGVASGKFLVQVQAPDAPTAVGAAAGDGALRVSWKAPTGGVTVDHYIITATPTDGSGVPVSSGEVTATSGVRLAGLTNDVPYTVSVVAYSKGGNPSPAGTAAAPVAPMPMEDFWDWYELQDGTETGGCSSGSAGAVALLGLAALVATRRRRK
jgi:MYXO-CTERM domain-containing protein